MIATVQVCREIVVATCYVAAPLVYEIQWNDDKSALVFVWVASVHVYEVQCSTLQGPDRRLQQWCIGRQAVVVGGDGGSSENVTLCRRK